MQSRKKCCIINCRAFKTSQRVTTRSSWKRRTKAKSRVNAANNNLWTNSIPASGSVKLETKEHKNPLISSIQPFIPIMQHLVSFYETTSAHFAVTTQNHPNWKIKLIKWKIKLNSTNVCSVENGQWTYRLHLIFFVVLK